MQILLLKMAQPWTTRLVKQYFGMKEQTGRIKEPNSPWTSRVHYVAGLVAGLLPSTTYTIVFGNTKKPRPLCCLYPLEN